MMLETDAPVMIGAAMTTRQIASWLRERPGLSIVEFTARECAPCRALAPALDRLGVQHGVRILFVDAMSSPSAADHFGVQAVPALLAFRDGCYVRTIPANPATVAGDVLALAGNGKGR